MISAATESGRPASMRPAQPRMVVAIFAAFVATVLAWTVVDDPAVALFYSVGAFGILVAVAASGLAATIAAVALFCVSPGVLGEQSLQLSVIALVIVLGAFLATKRDAVRFPSLARLALIAAPVIVGAGLVAMDSAIQNAAPYLIVFGIVAAALTRQSLIRPLLRALAILVLASTLSYAITLVMGFEEGTRLDLEARTVTLHPPFTLTTGGFNYIPDAPRMSLGVGEPGLNAFFLIPTFVFFVTAKSLRVRVLGVAGTIAAAVFSQSTGIFVAGGVAVAAWATRELWVRRRRLFALVAAGAGIAFGPELVQSALTTKALGAGTSVTDRGIFDAGSRSVGAEGNINLLVAWQNAPIGVILIGAALLILTVVAVRTSVGTFAIVFFAITAIFSQPSQWQIGAWLLLVLVVIESERQSKLINFEQPFSPDPVETVTPASAR